MAPLLTVGSRRHPGAVMITGATGFVGRLVTTGLLMTGTSRLVLPVRSGRAPEDVLRAVAEEAAAAGGALCAQDLQRICVITLPPNALLPDLEPALRREGVTEIIHCAGCLDYFDREKLTEANIELTQQLVRLGERLVMDRFVFLSTAYSSGYVKGPIPERIHPEHADDPTLYTETKRYAESIVARGELPYLIVRPSAVIGDSQTGRYSGGVYGLYQLWWANERFLCDRYRPVLHLVAPRIPIGIVHQDAFQAGFLAAYHHQADNSIIHITSRRATAPTMRDFWDLWVDRCSRPQEVHYYDRLDDVPLDRLEKYERIRLKFTEVNTEITSHEWAFEATSLDRLREQGLVFHDATVETVARCQERFVEQSQRIQKFRAKYVEQIRVSPQILERSP